MVVCPEIMALPSYVAGYWASPSCSMCCTYMHSKKQSLLSFTSKAITLNCSTLDIYVRKQCRSRYDKDWRSNFLPDFSAPLPPQLYDAPKIPVLVSESRECSASLKTRTSLSLHCVVSLSFPFTNLRSHPRTLTSVAITGEGSSPGEESFQRVEVNSNHSTFVLVCVFSLARK